MKEFEAFEIEIEGTKGEAEVKTGLCPILKANCHGPLCMWWVKDFDEARNKLQANCAVALIAIGLNDESLHRISGQPRED